MPDQSLPSSEWQDAMKKRVKEDNPSYSDDQVSKTVGDIFYNKLSPAEREKAKSTTQTAALDKVSSDIEEIDYLNEIKEKIKKLVYEAKDIVQGMDGNGTTSKRAESYWIPHILGALDKDNEYVGGSMYTMEDTINELEKNLVDADEEESGLEE